MNVLGVCSCFFCLPDQSDHLKDVFLSDLFQGTIALELLEQVDQLDAILVPVSGGGLSSGIALAAKHLKPEIRSE